MNLWNRRIGLVLCAWALCAPAGASTITPVFDHFDDGVLDPAWTVSLGNASGWTYAESGSLLSVTGIAPTVLNTGNGGAFARVTLSRSFTPLGDLDAFCDVSWNSQGSVNAMQGVGIHLLDDAGSIVATAEYADGWVGFAGTRLWGFGASRQHQGPGALPLAGSARLGIGRVADAMSVTWNGTPLANGTSSTPVSQVDLVFWYYAYSGAGGTSSFGGEAIDMVRIEGTAVPVPEPSTLLLVGSGAAFIAVRTLRRRAGRDGRAGSSEPDDATSSAEGGPLSGRPAIGYSFDPFPAGDLRSAGRRA